MTDLTATHYHDHSHATPIGTLSLDYESRFLRRKTVTLTDGRSLLVNLPRTTSLQHGGVLITDAGEILIEAAPEVLLEITHPEPTRIAWHIGNRHTPCQITADHLLIRPDHVIRDLMVKLGATVREITAPFTPEGGAYGHGRTHGHSH